MAAITERDQIRQLVSAAHRTGHEMMGVKLGSIDLIRAILAVKAVAGQNGLPRRRPGFAFAY